MLRVSEEDPQDVRTGKQLIEQFLGEKGASSFEWDRAFDTRDWSLRFDWNGSRYESGITYKALMDLARDTAKNSKLAAIWKEKRVFNS